MPLASARCGYHIVPHVHSGKSRCIVTNMPQNDATVASGAWPEKRRVVLQNLSPMTRHHVGRDDATLGTPLWERALPSG